MSVPFHLLGYNLELTVANACDRVNFEDEDQPRSIETTARLYAPTGDPAEGYPAVDPYKHPCWAFANY